MFERFTDRARRVVVLAQEEARLLNHNYIGTEHMLLGLIHEGEGVAAKALESLGISLEAVRAQVEEIIGQGQSAPTGHIPFTPRAKKVLELSLREALQLGHNYIGTEHILLGLIREGEGVAAQVLVKLGADLTRVRQQVVQVLSGYAGGEDVGARMRLVRMTVPDDLREAEEQLAQVRREKEAAIEARGLREGRNAARPGKAAPAQAGRAGAGMDRRGGPGRGHPGKPQAPRRGRAAAGAAWSARDRPRRWGRGDRLNQPGRRPSSCCVSRRRHAGHDPQPRGLVGQQLGRISPQPGGGPDDGGDLVVIDLRGPHPMEARPTGQARDRHARHRPGRSAGPGRRRGAGGSPPPTRPRRRPRCGWRS